MTGIEWNNWYMEHLKNKVVSCTQVEELIAPLGWFGPVRELSLKIGFIKKVVKCSTCRIYIQEFIVDFEGIINCKSCSIEDKKEYKFREITDWIKFRKTLTKFSSKIECLKMLKSSNFKN